MTIRYELGAHWLCITPCPHGMKCEDGKQTINVNTYACSDCPYYVSEDYKNQTIECSHPLTPTP